MTLDKIIVIIAALAGMASTYWYFLVKKEVVVSVSESVDIIVEGGYSPNTISIPIGKKTKISFIRRDPSSCLEEVILSDFKIKKYLPLNKKVTVELTPQMTGEFKFTCAMNMFHGKIIVS